MNLPKTWIIIIFFSITIILIACSKYNYSENKERRISSKTITFKIVNGHFSKSSVDGFQDQASLRASFKIEKKVIYKAQKSLSQLGYDPGPIDGILGPRTEKAIKKFQQNNKLGVTGNLDEQTSIQLFQKISRIQKTDRTPIGKAQKLAIMTPGEAHQVIEEHIKNDDIKIETYAVYRNFSKNTDSEVNSDIFHGIKIDSKNYLVIALCEPSYKVEIHSKSIQDKLSKLKLNIPDNPLSFTFNGLLYSTVDLKVKANPVISNINQDDIISNAGIPKGGYEWSIGEYGLLIGNTLIFFQTPLNKKFPKSLISEKQIVKIELSSQKSEDISLNLDWQ